MQIVMTKMEELRAKAVELAASHEDEIVMNSWFVENYTNGSVTITPLARQQILAHHGIPGTFANKLDDLGLNSTVMNTLSDISSKVKNTPRMIRYATDSDGNRFARAFLSNSYERLDNLEVIDAIESSNLGDLGLSLRSSDISPDGGLQMTFVSEKLSREVTVGDELQFGISIHNSEVGQSSFRIVPFIYRLVCSNGMVAASSDGLGGYRRFHIGKKQELGKLLPACEVDSAERKLNPEIIREKVQELLSDEKIQAIMDKIANVADDVIDAPTIQIVANLRKEIQLTDGEADKVAEFIDNSDVEGETTVWSVLNAVTKTAHTAKDYERNIELQQLGWRILHNTNAKTYERPVKLAA